MANQLPKYVFHEEYGEGEIINGMNTIDEEGHITNLDVMFEHKIVHEVPVDELFQISENFKYQPLLKIIEEGRGRPKGSVNVKGRKNEPFVKKARAMPKPKNPDEDEDEKDAYPEASSDGKHVINALGGILDRDAPTGKVSGHTITKKKAKELHTHLLGIEKPEERAMQSAQVHAGTHPMMKEDVEEVEKKKLIGKQKKLDKNHNGKLDAEDFKLIRKEEIEVLPPMSEYAKANRFISVENAALDIMKNNRNLRQEAKEEEFKSNNPDIFKKNNKKN